MKAETVLNQSGVNHNLIPIPKNISFDCGICVRLDSDDIDKAVCALHGNVSIERIEDL